MYTDRSFFSNGYMGGMRVGPSGPALFCITQLFELVVACRPAPK